MSRPWSVMEGVDDGRRNVSVATRPNALHAHFTGIGLGSTNSLLCNGIRQLVDSARLGKCLRRQFAHVSHLARRYVSRNGNHAMTAVRKSSADASSR